MKKLSPKIILLLGSDEDKQKYIQYLGNKHAHNFIILNKEEMLKVHDDVKESDQKEVIKRVI